jgi:uncharacterized membrane protein YuzA (DUF378 family)
MKCYHSGHFFFEEGMMEYTLKTKFLIACVGALSPILISLFAFDLNSILANATMLTVGSYVVQKAGLCIAACIVVWLSPDAKNPLTIYQLGIAAPALLGGIISGAYHTQQSNQHAMLEIPAIIGTASAQPAPNATPSNIQPRDCKRDLTASQQILKGLVGALPSDRWFVVYSSNRLAPSAIGDVQDIQRKYPARFQAHICAPADGDDRYRVVIGANLNYDAATKLRGEAIAAGFPKDIWLWSPIN